MAEKKSQQTELDTLLGKETKKTVKWTDSKDKKHTKEITLKEPKARVSSQLVDLSNADGNIVDLATIADIVMEDVILKPRMSFEHLNTSLPDSLATKKAQFNDGKIKLEYKFPDYRTALSIAQVAQSNTGAVHNTKVMDNLIDNKVIKYKDEPIDWDFFDEDGKGLVMDVLMDATKYIMNVLYHGGFLPIILASFRMASESAKRIK